jgi:hypothetical protein
MEYDFSRASTGNELEQIEDSDMDSLFVMPLSIIPLENPSLRRARLIKNQRLEGVIELFSDIETGSGQVEINQIPSAMGWDLDKGIPNDLLVLRRLAPLPSYDVYSLRVQLRQLGVSVSASEALRLSDEKNRELAGYMRTFTGPLLQQIYGTEGVNIQSFEDIIALFRDPDPKAARQKLKIMADKLEIGVMEIPAFLEDYGDIFLSLSYYRQCLDRLQPHMNNYLSSMEILRKNFQVKSDPTLMRTCESIERVLNDLSMTITSRFEYFDRETKEMWSSISAHQFRHVKAMIESYHVTIGGILCALTVKMNAWAKHFPKLSVGGPIRRGEFIMSEMKQGIDEMRRLEKASARSMLR